MDKLLTQKKAGDINRSNCLPRFCMLSYIGLEPEVNGVPFYTFRAFYTRIGVFEVLGQRFELQSVVDEIYEVHRKLLTIAESGYDFRISTK